MFVMLRGSWPGIFRRAVRDGSGAVTSVLEFSPGTVYELLDDNLEACAGDIGLALVEVVLDDRGRPREAAGSTSYPAALAAAAGARELPPAGPPPLAPEIGPPPEALPAEEEGAEEENQSRPAASAASPAASPTTAPPADDWASPDTTGLTEEEGAEQAEGADSSEPLLARSKRKRN